MYLHAPVSPDIGAAPPDPGIEVPTGRTGALRLVPEVEESPELPIPMPEVDGISALAVWFQPIYDLDTGRILAEEALLRGLRGDASAVSPVRFLPGTEPAQGRRIDLYVLQTVLEHAHHRQRVEPEDDRRFHVNVSPHHLQEEAYLEAAEALLRRSGSVCHRLVLEVTECRPFEAADLEEGMDRLREHGVSFALDDLGKGYSNLHCLGRLPFELVKLDRRLVEDLPHNPRSPVLLRKLLHLASSLGVSTVVEGIETPQQLSVLQQLGCRRGQGYLLGRPAPSREAT